MTKAWFTLPSVTVADESMGPGVTVRLPDLSAVGLSPVTEGGTVTAWSVAACDETEFLVLVETND